MLAVARQGARPIASGMSGAAAPGVRSRSRVLGAAMPIVIVMNALYPRHRAKKSLYQRRGSLIEAIIRVSRLFSHFREPASLIAICSC